MSDFKNNIIKFVNVLDVILLSHAISLRSGFWRKTKKNFEFVNLKSSPTQQLKYRNTSIYELQLKWLMVHTF